MMVVQTRPEPAGVLEAPQVARHACGQCQRCFLTDVELSQHVQRQHVTDERAVTGTEAVAADSVSPAASDDGGCGGLHRCGKCEASFPDCGQLDRHVMVHASAAQVCHVCNKTFANVYRLQRHLISHDESSDLRKFKCPECGKAFKFKHHLKEHVRIHSGEKPFECNNCGKRFSHSGSYSSHMTSKKCWNASSVSPNCGSKMSMTSSPITSSNGQPKSTAESLTSLYAQHLLSYNPAAMAAAQISSNPYLALTAAYASPLMLPTLTNPSYAYTALLEKSKATAAAATLSLTAGVGTPLDENENKSKSLEDSKPIDVVGDFSQNESFEQRTDAIFSKNIGEAAEERNCESNELWLQQQEEHEVERNRQEAERREMIRAIQEQEMKKLELERQARMAALPALKNQIHSLQSRDIDLPCSSIVKVENNTSSEVKDAPAVEGSDELLLCQACNAPFSSPIDLHQHERYLCSQQHHRMTNPGEIIDDEFLDKDGQQYRVRSLINEDQLTKLKDMYQVNPRPSKEELAEIGISIGFTKRVVQVWFQNMRARDRRRGRHFPPLLNSTPSIKSESNNESSSSPISTTARKSHANTVFSIPMLLSVDPQDQPLDLSLKKGDSESNPGSQRESPLQMSPEPDSSVGSLNSSFSSSSTSPVPTSPAARFIGSKRKSRPWALSDFSVDEAGVYDEGISLEEGEASPSQKKMKRNWKGHRGDEGVHTCDQCEKTFNKQSSLARHKYEHSGQRPFPCLACGKAFKHKHHLTEHSRLHSGERPYQCDKCLKRFSHSGSYSQHLNHRYKYCKPLKSELDAAKVEQENSLDIDCNVESIIKDKNYVNVESEQMSPISSN